MKNICVGIIASLLLAIPLSLWSRDAPDGAEIFKTRCAACHGDKGEGTLAGKIPAVKGTAMDIEKLLAFITKGQGGKMVHTTPIVNLNDGEAKAVAEYVKSLKQTDSGVHQ
jgi:mono/diheme cytochrome c family protein